MNKNDLIKRLKENDSLVKFVPFGYKTGIQNLFEFQKILILLPDMEKEGAEKIAEVASKYKNQPYIWSFGSVNEEKVKNVCFGQGLGLRLLVGCLWRLGCLRRGSCFWDM